MADLDQHIAWLGYGLGPFGTNFIVYCMKFSNSELCVENQLGIGNKSRMS